MESFVSMLLKYCVQFFSWVTHLYRNFAELYGALREHGDIKINEMGGEMSI